MNFTVLGSGTTIPDRERGPAGFLVEVGGRAWLVDGGSGTLQRCLRAGIDPRDLAGGFYSHRHPDHCADLLPLLFTFRVAGRASSYPIWAGEGFAAYLAGLEALHGRWTTFGQAEGAVVTELSLTGPDAVDLGDLQVQTRPAAHSAGALHLRFEAAGSAVVFSGDTGPSRDLAELARDADLLVCECASPETRPIEGHLTPSDVAEVVTAAQPKEVWLTHLSPGVDPAEAVATVARTGVPTRRAADLDRWSR